MTQDTNKKVVVPQVISSYEIDTVLTFDRGGVSGHPNHASLYNAMVFLMIENRLPQSNFSFFKFDDTFWNS